MKVSASLPQHQLWRLSAPKKKWENLFIYREKKKGPERQGQTQFQTLFTTVNVPWLSHTFIHGILSPAVNLWAEAPLTTS